MSGAVSPSLFDEITIQSADDTKRTVDIRGGVLSINYYESILSPSYSMKLVVIDTAESIEDKKTGRPTTIYQGLPLRGGEKVYIRISGNTRNNPPLEFVNKPLIVRGISNASIGGQKQIFSLDLVPETAIINEVNFVEKVYTSKPISLIVEDVLKNKLNLRSGEYKIDPTSGPIGFSGNMEKPFKVLNKLAKNAVSTNTNAINISAGFFCFQTREKFKFTSIDSLCAQKAITEYVYTEININAVDFHPTPELPSLDRKIISYTIIKNQDIVGNLKTGAYATTRQFFNPVSFQVTFPEVGSYSSIDYGNKPLLPTLGAQPLGEDIFNNSSDGNNSNTVKNYFNQSSRILNGVLPVGTYTGKEVSKVFDEEPFLTESQRKTRYNTLFNQALQVLVPLNSKLRAGDVISLKIPTQGLGNVSRTDEEISGAYLIKDICHNYSADGSYTSMKVVRDTYGTRKTYN
tara:strand:+ start:41 stop:1420 length:1380 start_codon:yes stop_codon:yes gene_type:complete